MRIYDIMPSVKDLIPYDYEQIKSAEYEKIINATLAKFSKNKKIIQISGAPGAGKTTFCCRKYPNSFLSFDKIMENLSSYQKDLREAGDKQAFANNELTARIIGYEVLRRALEKNMQVVIEHSGVNPAHLELFDYAKAHGYKTEACFILCEQDKALERVKKREAKTHRYTPESMLKKRFAGIEEYLPKYEKIADNVHIYDTSSNKFVLKK